MTRSVICHERYPVYLFGGIDGPVGTWSNGLAVIGDRGPSETNVEQKPTAVQIEMFADVVALREKFYAIMKLTRGYEEYEMAETGFIAISYSW